MEFMERLMPTKLLSIRNDGVYVRSTESHTGFGSESVER